MNKFKMLHVTMACSILVGGLMTGGQVMASSSPEASDTNNANNDVSNDLNNDINQAGSDARTGARPGHKKAQSAVGHRETQRRQKVEHIRKLEAWCAENQGYCNNKGNNKVNSRYESSNSLKTNEAESEEENPESHTEDGR